MFRRYPYRSYLLLPFLLLLGLFPTIALADELVWATGKVLDASGRPRQGAIVAVYDDSNKVVDYARTDENGEYALALPSRALHLERKKNPGFLATVFSGVTRFVGSTVGFVANPMREGVRAITSSQAANYTNPLTRAQIQAGGAVVDQVLFGFTPRQKKVVPKADRKQTGAFLMKVIANNRNDLVGVGRVYWLQEEVLRAGGKERRTVAAWLDPVKLTEADDELPSSFDETNMRFISARVEPSLAEYGQTVRIAARFKTPTEPETNVIVVARHNRTGQKWELTRNNDGYWSTEILVDKKFPRDDQVISLIAYTADEQRPGRRQNVESAIERSGLWNPKTDFVPNPLLLVSRNRADLNLTILVPKK